LAGNIQIFSADRAAFAHPWPVWRDYASGIRVNACFFHEPTGKLSTDRIPVPLQTFLQLALSQAGKKSMPVIQPVLQGFFISGLFRIWLFRLIIHRGTINAEQFAAANQR
jgi:hypothetical protein